MPSSYARRALSRSWRPVNAMRSTASIGDFLASAIVSYTLAWPTETCGSTNVAFDDAITMSASATKCSPRPRTRR